VQPGTYKTRLSEADVDTWEPEFRQTNKNYFILLLIISAPGEYNSISQLKYEISKGEGSGSVLESEN
jgi:hypothetical protein